MVPNEELVMLFGVVMIASVVGRDVHNFYGNRFSTTESDSIINRMVSLQKRSQRGRIDRHRFFHFGLGKRADQERALIDGFVSAGNRIVRKSSLYKTLQMYNDETNKRDPEMFSEELYPLQAGKQKLEAYLDSALKDSEETTDAIMESAVQTEDTNEEIADQNNDNNNNVKQLDERPFDLTFASPDLDFGRYGYNKGQMQDDVAGKTIGLGLQKRWWASERLNQFRLAKSSRWSPSKGLHSRRIDPVLFFIGLGK